jgi:phosphoglycerate dehydrogenase-like enzyme
VTLRLAVLDDWQGIARGAAAWERLAPHGVTVDVFGPPFASEDAAADALAPYDILIPTRERTLFPGSLVARLPKLRMIAQTGRIPPSLDRAACAARGIVLTTTEGDLVPAATGELAFGLLLACARGIAVGDAGMRTGRWQEGVPEGAVLEGRTLGLLGLGRIGARVAAMGRAFGMRVIGWSQNLTPERAAEAGAIAVDKATLFAESDAISLHVVLSDRTRGIVDEAAIAAMKPGAILVNTARGPLVDEAALLAALHAGRIRAGLDVYGTEPVPADHPIRSAPNTVLSPHLGFSAAPIFRQFYGEALEAVLAWLAAGAPKAG